MGNDDAALHERLHAVDLLIAQAEARIDELDDSAKRQFAGLLVGSTIYFNQMEVTSAILAVFMVLSFSVGQFARRELIVLMKKKLVLLNERMAATIGEDVPLET